jgi:hypothetical protein
LKLNSGEIIGNGRENGVWVAPLCLEPTHGPYADISPEGESKRTFFIVTTKKNTPPEQGILFQSIEVTMSLLFTHSTRTILEGVNPAFASQSPEIVILGTFLKLSFHLPILR